MMLLDQGRLAASHSDHYRQVLLYMILLDQGRLAAVDRWLPYTVTTIGSFHIRTFIMSYFPSFTIAYMRQLEGDSCHSSQETEKSKVTTSRRSSTALHRGAPI